jgi:hypothetical protein
MLLLPVSIITALTPNLETPISESERKTLVDNLKETKDHVLQSIKGLSDAQLNFKSAPEKWSIRQCAEHIAVSESLIFYSIQKALLQAADSAKRKAIRFTDEDIIQKTPDRSRKFHAPEGIRPTGRYKTIEEAVTLFTAERDKHIDFVNATNEDLRNHTLQHPAFGTLDCYQFLLLISVHAKRHTLQIEEIKADKNFSTS